VAGLTDSAAGALAEAIETNQHLTSLRCVCICHSVFVIVCLSLCVCCHCVCLSLRVIVCVCMCARVCVVVCLRAFVHSRVLSFPSFASHAHAL
jgi:hypothetical protein